MSGAEGAPPGPLLPPLAAVFPPVSRQEWEAAVEATLKGRPFASLASSTDGGVELQPLYVPSEAGFDHDESGLPGAAPTTRGAVAVPRADGRWDVRRPLDGTDAATANRDFTQSEQRGQRETLAGLGLTAPATGELPTTVWLQQQLQAVSLNLGRQLGVAMPTMASYENDIACFGNT